MEPHDSWLWRVSASAEMLDELCIALRSALDGDAVEPVTMRLEVDTKNVVATIDKIRNDLIGEGLEEPFAADCCPYCEALIHPAPQPTQKE